MTLRTKIVLVVCLSCALSIVALFFVQKTILSTRFASLERETTNDNIGRALNAVWEDASSVDTTVGDWAPWDDTYVFVQDGNSDYIANNLTDGTVSNLGMNLILYVNNAGELVYGKAMDLENGVEVPLPSSMAELVSPGSPLMQMTDEQSSMSGIVSLPEGPLLVAAQPILTSQKQGPIQGTLIMGRYLDLAEVQSLAGLTQLSIVMYSLQDGSLPADFQLAQSSLSEEQPTFVHPLSQDFVAGYALLTDIYGDPALVLRVDQTRAIYMQGQQTIGYFILTLLVLFLWSGAASFLLLDRFLLSRLSRLRADVEKVGAAHNPSERVPDDGEDEFADVAQAVNGMLSSLEQAQHELLASETRNRALVAALPDLIFRVDRDGMLLDRVPARADGVAVAGQESTRRWPGETADERKTFSTEILQHARPHINRALETKETSIFEFQVALNSRVCHYEARVVASGEDEALVIARDITQKKHEEEMRRRGLLLKEVHHRVKNNLQVVSGLLYLQSKRMSDKNMIEMFNESSNRIQSMSLIHQKLYQSKDAATIDFDGYVRDLVSALLHSYGTDRSAIRVVLDIDHTGLGMDSAVPCGLIINELVSNSFKHAFPGGRRGEVRIAMSRHDGDKITLVVADNGVGLPENLDFPNTESLGLQLVVTLVDQLRGSITLSRDAGTKLTVVFTEVRGMGAVEMSQQRREYAVT
jgi:two-component sensor histidine kinase/sensor domain CHASE-containing protein